MHHGNVISSSQTPPRVGDIIYAQSECGQWFYIKVLFVRRSGVVRAQVIPSEVERYRKAWGRTVSDMWTKKLSYYHDPNDIEFYKR